MPGEAPSAERGEPGSVPSREIDWVFAASNGFAHRVGDGEELHQLLAAALQAPPAAGLEWIQVQHAVETHVYVAFDATEDPERAIDSADPAADSAATNPAVDPAAAQQKWRVSADGSTQPALGEAAGTVLTPDEAAQLARRLL